MIIRHHQDPLATKSHKESHLKPIRYDPGVPVTSGFRHTFIVTVMTTLPAALSYCFYRSVELPDVYDMLRMSYNARAQAQHHRTTR